MSEATLPTTAPDRVEAPRALGGRIADRLNPVLVREVQQALNSRGFTVTLALSLAAVVVVALTSVSDSQGRQAGLQALGNTLLVLVPLSFLVVPFQAFLATRQEVAAGTVEHLLLSRLTPSRVVRGKLFAAAVQLLLYIAVFAPLMALTYQLRGVDVVTIAAVISLVLVAGMTACTIGVAGGALCRIPHLQPLAFLIVVAGLVALVVGCSGIVGTYMMGSSLRRAFGFLTPFEYLLRFFALAAASVVLFAMVGSSTLAHPYENRSTGFRLFAVALVVLLPGWLLWTSSSVDLYGLARDLTIVTAPFWLLATTEEERLSPRVRITVPRNPLLAALASPFLPGCGRGLLFVILLAAAALVAPGLWEGPSVPLASAPSSPGGAHVLGSEPTDFSESLLAWAYVVWYAGVAAFVRRRLAPGPARNWAGRGFALIAIGLPIVAVVIVDIATKGRARGWHLGHVVNPFHTVERSPHFAVYPVVGAAALVALLGNARAMARGIAETVAASLARRRRAA